MRGSLLALAAVTACLSAATHQPRSTARFDGERALDHLRQLVAIGPRPAGSPGARHARAYITTHLKAAGWTVVEQAFDARTPLGVVRMVNIRATLTARAPGERLIIAGHYDTKLFREFSFVGANDGGSSTAFLLELGRVLAVSAATSVRDAGTRMPIELVFFDGEEAVVEWEANDHTYGSRHYVQAARTSGELRDIRGLVLVDMIGDRDLRIRRDSHSTPWLTDAIWAAAKRLGRREFVDEAMPVEDDHREFLQVGIPAVDIIDLDYGAWHTAEDTLDKVAASSLQAVGDVLMEALPEIERLVAARR